MKTKRFTVAVIGCGKIGAEVASYSKRVSPGTHAEAWRDNKNAELVALVDRDPKHLRAASRHFPNVPVFTDASKMFKTIKPDIVSVATPTESHAHYVALASTFGTKAILCEKPIASNIQEAKKMIATAHKAGSALFINYQREFDPLLISWAEKIKRGILGKIFQVDAYYYDGLYATHLFDLIRMFFGKPSSVTAHVNKETSWNPKNPNIDGSLIYKNGLSVSVRSLSRGYGYFGLRIFGEKGMVHVTNLGCTIEYFKKIPNKNYKGYFQLSEKPFEEGKTRGMLAGSVAHVVSSLQGSGRTRSTGEDGLVVLKIQTALLKSAKSGKKETL
jgi:predicted dehydrogenase